MDANRSTAGNYLSHLAAIFAIARPAWGHRLDPQAMADAQKVAKRLGLIGKSKSRDRRPTLAELDLIMTLFKKRSEARPDVSPMHYIVAFALFYDQTAGRDYADRMERP